LTIEPAQGEAIFLSHGNLRLARNVDQLLTKAPGCKCRLRQSSQLYPGWQWHAWLAQRRETGWHM